MNGPRIARHKRRVMLGVILALVLVLGACGGEDDTPAPSQSDQTAQTPVSEATEPPADQAEATEVPPLPEDDQLVEEAGSRARADLADRLGVSLSEIRILDRDTALLLDDPLLCPELLSDNIAIAFVYVQHEQIIYPYQYYVATEADGVIVEACEDTLVDEDVLTIPTPNIRLDLTTVIKADLIVRGVNPDDGQFTTQPMAWHDTALGCPVPAGSPTPAPELVQGFLITYTLDDRSYEYHTDDTGERIIYCEPPMGHAANAAFLFSLREDDTREIEVPDETVIYNGLDAAGEVVLLTDNQYRISLFDFDTPDLARQAARQIDDERVSHIYVSGYVLIVQEENSPQVSNILLQYAERVRSPILERQQAEDAAAEVEASAEDEDVSEDVE